MAEGTRFAQLQESFNSLKKTQEEGYNSLKKSQDSQFKCMERQSVMSPQGLITNLVSEIPPSPSYKAVLMAKGTRFAELQESFNSLKKTEEESYNPLKKSQDSQFNCMETEMLSLKW